MGEEPELQQCKGTKVSQHKLQAQFSPASPAGFPLLPWPLQWTSSSWSPASRGTQNPQCWTCFSSALPQLPSEGDGGYVSGWAAQTHSWSKQQQDLSVNESIRPDGLRRWWTARLCQPNSTSDSWDRIGAVLQLIHSTTGQSHPSHGCSSWHPLTPSVHFGAEALLPAALADFCSYQNAQCRCSRQRRNDSPPAQLQPTKRRTSPAATTFGTNELYRQRLRGSLSPHPKWVPRTPA